MSNALTSSIGYRIIVRYVTLHAPSHHTATGLRHIRQYYCRLHHWIAGNAAGLASSALTAIFATSADWVAFLSSVALSLNANAVDQLTASLSTRRLYWPVVSHWSAVAVTRWLTRCIWSICIIFSYCIITQPLSDAIIHLIVSRDFLNDKMKPVKTDRSVSIMFNHTCARRS